MGEALLNTATFQLVGLFRQKSKWVYTLWSTKVPQKYTIVAQHEPFVVNEPVHTKGNIQESRITNEKRWQKKVAHF